MMIIQLISKKTNLNPSYIAKVVRSASHRYRDYTIKKAKGGRRKISHPAKELKFLQRWMVDNVLSNLPVHKSVFSYKKRTGIKNLADAHKGFRFFLRTDFLNFFPSIKTEDIANLIKVNLGRINLQLSNSDIEIICNVVCKEGKLTIGAPSSPYISNAILFKFDKYWFEKCRQQNIVYSRYADDLFFSTNEPHQLKLIYQELEKYLSNMKLPILKLNKKKTVFSSKKYKRIVTGLVLTSQGEVSIGRQQKRFIKSLIYKYKNNSIESNQISYLRGYLAYLNAVEPIFLENLKTKYGNDTIRNIISNESE